MFEFKHPKYYKNLRKLYRSRNRDGAISLQAGTPDARRTPRTGQQADKPSSSQARERASAQASSGARINKR
jgi:hypothetical protein